MVGVRRRSERRPRVFFGARVTLWSSAPPACGGRGTLARFCPVLDALALSHVDCVPLEPDGVRHVVENETQEVKSVTYQRDYDSDGNGQWLIQNGTSTRAFTATLSAPTRSRAKLAARAGELR